MKKILIILLITVSFIFAQMHRGMNPAVENYRIYKMTNDLELTPKQSQQFFPMLRSHIMKMENIEKNIKELDRKVNSDNSIDKAEYVKIKNKLLNLENDKLNEKLQFLNDLENVLEPEQIAKYMFFDRKFRRDLQNRLKHRRR
ncbi:MAG: Spy/CpxP family protein refolding chaperone [Candidatus Marinimicrobia bacterium]|nr:Spy/CpxP family protein refolding chaperone [Candidatus Neomarinimicrobiota bacterium]